MNVFYSPSTQGLKEIPDFDGATTGTETVYFTQQHVYAIDTEGTLYVSPRFVDGSYETTIWEEVEYDELNQLTYIQDALVEQAQKEGWYYTQAQ